MNGIDTAHEDRVISLEEAADLLASGERMMIGADSREAADRIIELAASRRVPVFRTTYLGHAGREGFTPRHAVVVQETRAWEKRRAQRV